MTQNLDLINYIIARFLINVTNVDYRHKRFFRDLTYKTRRIIIDCVLCDNTFKLHLSETQ